MKRIRASDFVLFAVIAVPALAHRAPNSVVRLEFGAQRVSAEVMVPRSELAVALPGDQSEPEFIAYLLRHIAVETPDGIPWRIQVRGVRDASYLEHDYLLADIDLVPPRDASPLRFVLVDDAVTHEVRNHVVWVVSSQGDGLLGALQYPARRLVIERQPAPSPVAHQR
jgi:hypothetical protein